MKKNDVFELKIEDMSGEGLGIGKLDGFVWFVKDTVIGDVVEAAATKVKKNYGFARLVRVLAASPARVAAPCSIAKQCGGCQLQQMSYEAQLRFKADKVYNNLLRLGGVEKKLLDAVFEPIVGMEHPFRYRNKAQFPIARQKTTDGNGSKIVAGFYAGRTHSVIACEDCLLGVTENREILQKIIGWMKAYGIEPYHEESHAGLVRHVLIRKGFHTGQLMVCLVINGRQLPHAEALKELLCGEADRCVRQADDDDSTDMALLRSEAERCVADIAAKQRESARVAGEEFAADDMDLLQERCAIECKVDSLSFSVNTEKTNVIMGTEIVHLYGLGYIEDYIGGVKFRISPLSFFQVNPVQTEKLYGTALEYADLSGNETVWDLYCGIGTISLFLAQKAKQVYGVEIIPQAIADAKQNAQLNGMDNATFYVGAAEQVLPEWYDAHREEKIDVICVDPPRKGCDEACLETIIKMQPKKLVYVSCDSATLARDIKYLRANGYELKRVRPVDMFGQTVHCECCVKLERKE